MTTSPTKFPELNAVLVELVSQQKYQQPAEQVRIEQTLDFVRYALGRG